MSSHSSTAAASKGASPSQKRGLVRVARILDAARRLFLAQGYDGVTMTAIAAASGTAIGSLYRFFPSKEDVADGLLARYAERLGDRFATLLPVASKLGPALLADALIDRMLESADDDRELSLALLDSLPDHLSRRLRIRGEVFGGLEAVLCAAAAKPLASAVTGAVLQVLKSLAEADRYAALPGPDATAVVAETRLLLARYLEARLPAPVIFPTGRR